MVSSKLHSPGMSSVLFLPCVQSSELVPNALLDVISDHDAAGKPWRGDHKVRQQGTTTMTTSDTEFSLRALCNCQILQQHSWTMHVDGTILAAQQ